jgi:hypothetical protein
MEKEFKYPRMVEVDTKGLAATSATTSRKTFFSYNFSSES